MVTHSAEAAQVVLGLGDLEAVEQEDAEVQVGLADARIQLERAAIGRLGAPTVASLNEALALQQQEILLLKEELTLLKLRLKEQGDTLADMADAPADERPPHY